MCTHFKANFTYSNFVLRLLVLKPKMYLKGDSLVISGARYDLLLDYNQIQIVEIKPSYRLDG